MSGFFTNGPSRKTSMKLEEVGSASWMNFENPLGVSYFLITRGRIFCEAEKGVVSVLALFELNSALKFDSNRE